MVLWSNEPPLQQSTFYSENVQTLPLIFSKLTGRSEAGRYILI